MANTFYVEHFRSLKNISFIVYALVGVQIIAFFIGIISSLIYLYDPDWFTELAKTFIGRIVLLSVSISPQIRIAAFVFTGVFFLIWLYRAYSNLSPLKARNLEYSPGWAVGWWFIPFANLVKPFQVTREVWTASDPEFNEDLGFMPVGPSSNSVLGFWWGTYLIGNILLRISDGLAKDRSNLKAAVLLALIGSAVDVMSAVLFLIIVNDITERQLERKAKLETIGFRKDQPPPPPSFATEQMV